MDREPGRGSSPRVLWRTPPGAFALAFGVTLCAQLDLSPAYAAGAPPAGDIPAGPARGQAPAPPATSDQEVIERRLEELEAQIAALRAEIARLRDGAGGASSSESLAARSGSDVRWRISTLVVISTLRSLATTSRHSSNFAAYW